MATDKPATFKMTPKQVKERYHALKGQRAQWESHWQELADFINPRKDDINRKDSPGNKKGVELLDNTAMQANELLAGALHGLLTNPNSYWFELSTGNEELDQKDAVRKFLQDCVARMHSVMNNSNFQTEIHELYLDLTCFGTAGMTIEEDEQLIVRFSTKPLVELFLEEDSRGRVSEVMRPFNWNAKKIVDMFGESAVTDKIREALEKNDQQKFEVVHAVYPKLKHGQAPGKMVKFPFISQFILTSEDHELKVEGFRGFPYITPRWTKLAGEVYGRSPGMNALPEAKLLNVMMETTIKSAQLAVAPPLMAPDDGIILPIVTKPHGINYYRAGTTDRIEPLKIGGQVDYGFQMIQNRQAKVREAFFVDQLQLNQGPQMTATEVLQRTEERMRLLGPMLGRQQSELLRPMIDRVFDIMVKRGLFPEPPNELGTIDKLEVQYSSMIAKAQRLSEGQNIMRTIEAVAPFIQLNPGVADNFDGDACVRIIAKTYGFPQKGLMDQDKIEKTRAARAQAQQEAAQTAQDGADVEQISKLAPAMAQAKTLAE